MAWRIEVQESVNHKFKFCQAIFPPLPKWRPWHVPCLPYLRYAMLLICARDENTHNPLCSVPCFACDQIVFPPRYVLVVVRIFRLETQSACFHALESLTTPVYTPRFQGEKYVQLKKKYRSPSLSSSVSSVNSEAVSETLSTNSGSAAAPSATTLEEAGQCAGSPANR